MALYVGVSEGRGRGVFTDKVIKKGEIIESAPVIDFPKEEWDNILDSGLGSYGFYWGENNDDGALVLGYGSLYNHSFKPNAVYIRRIDEKMMEYYAICDIKEGEEIFINYNEDQDNDEPLWFEVK